jgi:hypothetical protein
MLCWAPLLLEQVGDLGSGRPETTRHGRGPVPEDFRSIATLTAMLLALLDVSVRSQAVEASVATGRTVSVDDILASLGQAIEGGT